MDGFFHLEIDGLDPQGMRMQAFVANEALNATYTVTVTAVTKGMLDAATILGNKATLRVAMPGVERSFHGIVWRIDQQPVAVDRVQLQVVIVPRLAALRLGRDNRQWQDHTIQEVIVDLFTRADYPTSASQWHPTSALKHPNLMQRNESDLDFIDRLLAKAGIGYLIQNDFDQEHVVFFDDPRQLLAVEGVDALVNRDSRRFDIDTVFDLTQTTRARTAAVVLRDYDQTRPTNAPADTATGNGDGTEFYIHGRGVLDTDAAALRVLESTRAAGELISAGSFALGLEPGRRIKLDDPARDALTREVVITSVTHHGRMAGDGVEYRNHFRAIGVDVPYRPPVATRAHGTGIQRAFVSGPQGAELHADDLGRVRVRWAWDRSDHEGKPTSTWLRVGQLQMPGSMVIPRVGFEVKVATEQSDDDRPLVTGHLYNQEQPPPYGGQATVSSMQTATTDGGTGANELRIDDTAGSETILINASYDLQCNVGHDATWAVTNNETVDIGGNHSMAITGDLTATVAAARTLDVGGDETVAVESDYSQGVGGDTAETVGDARLHTIGGDQVDNVAGTLTRAIGAAQLISGVTGIKRKVVSGSDSTIGAAWIELVSDNRLSDVGSGRIETVGALKWIKAQNKLLSTGKHIAETVGAQTVKVGTARSDNAGKKLTITIKNATKLKGKNFNFTASDTITLKLGGCVIELKKNGAITVKGDTITLKNAKELAQLLYKGA